eukprot:TRINITY_DN90887_c0_g1_i1.p2 TRINITY_DN90887_c0_g1~~TRINITY_DN90887_c0_g1_i1.p2  ORF type:complete len:525 (+),score=176.89 TRINITY_DN90887_c0_g1_i1:86-1660(+)
MAFMQRRSRRSSAQKTSGQATLALACLGLTVLAAVRGSCSSFGPATRGTAFTAAGQPQTATPTSRAALARAALSQLSRGSDAKLRLQALGQESTEGAWDWWRSLCAGAAAMLCVLVAGPSILPASPPQFGAQPANAAEYGYASYSVGTRVNRDPISLLQIALPLEEALGQEKVGVIRKLQGNIEQIKQEALVRLWAKSRDAAIDCQNIIKDKKGEIIGLADASRKPTMEAKLDELNKEIGELITTLTAGTEAGNATAKDQTASKSSQDSARKCQQLVGEIEELMIPPTFKTPVAKEVNKDLPQLQGRAQVEFVFGRPAENRKKFVRKDASGMGYDVSDEEIELFTEAKMVLTLDGWTAPVNAGGFVDLVNRGFYTNKPVTRADGFVVESGAGPKEDKGGFRPSKDAKVRTMPLEVGLKGQLQPLYSETIDDAGKVDAQVRIPFQADGCIAMGHSDFDADNASSTFFLFIFESDMTPAGKNFLDGRFSTIGYTTEGADFVRQIAEGDYIKSAKVISGLENLKTAS